MLAHANSPVFWAMLGVPLIVFVGFRVFYVNDYWWLLLLCLAAPYLDFKRRVYPILDNTLIGVALAALASVTRGFEIPLAAIYLGWIFLTYCMNVARETAAQAGLDPPNVHVLLFVIFPVFTVLVIGCYIFVKSPLATWGIILLFFFLYAAALHKFSRWYARRLSQ